MTVVFTASFDVALFSAGRDAVARLDFNPPHLQLGRHVQARGHDKLRRVHGVRVSRVEAKQERERGDRRRGGQPEDLGDEPEQIARLRAASRLLLDGHPCSHGRRLVHDLRQRQRCLLRGRRHALAAVALRLRRTRGAPVFAGADAHGSKVAPVDPPPSRTRCRCRSASSAS